MLDKARRMLSYRVSVGQLIAVGLALGTPGGEWREGIWRRIGQSNRIACRTNAAALF